MKPRAGIIAAALIVALLLLATFLPAHDGSGTREQVWRGWPGTAAHRPYALAQDFLRERGTELELADRAAPSPRQTKTRCCWKTTARIYQKPNKPACANGWQRAACWCWKAAMRRAKPSA